MSNRNPQPSKAQSKSPNIRPKESEHLKQILQSKLISKTQADDFEEPLDFKIEIERRFQQCQSQKTYKFQLDTQSDDSLSDCDSLIGPKITEELIYTRSLQKIQLDKNQQMPHNLSLSPKSTENFSSTKERWNQQLLILKLKVTRAQSSIITSGHKNLKGWVQFYYWQNQSISRDPRFEQLIHRKKEPSVDSRSTSNNKSRVEQDRQFLMQQLLKVNGTRQPKLQYENPVARIHLKPNNSKYQCELMKEHVQPSQNNNYLNFQANFNNSIIYDNQIRVRTEVDDDEVPLYKANNLRQQYKQIRRPLHNKEPSKLNYTMDYRFLDQMERHVESKSQNKNYQL